MQSRSELVNHSPGLKRQHLWYRVERQCAAHTGQHAGQHPPRLRAVATNGGKGAGGVEWGQHPAPPPEQQRGVWELRATHPPQHPTAELRPAQYGQGAPAAVCSETLSQFLDCGVGYDMYWTSIGGTVYELSTATDCAQ